MRLNASAPGMHEHLIQMFKHAWTFAGSGQFECVSPWTYRIEDNPVVRGEISQAPLCTWHAAVFEHLYQVLVHPR
ncbi:MAG: hypothetical protein AAFN80_13550, partial [Pseudomonadota bacterium]